MIFFNVACEKRGLIYSVRPDAIKDPQTGYYDSRDPFTALPKVLTSPVPYASFTVDDDALKQKPKALQGLRVAILREHMVKRTKNHEDISDRIDKEIKTVLRDQLGAALVESVAVGYADDPEVPNLSYTFADALSEILPRLIPEIFSRRDSKGELIFAVPGHDVSSYDYLLKLSKRQAPLTSAINMTNFATFGAVPCHSAGCGDVGFDIDRYLVDRGDKRITNWAAWTANAKFREDDSRAGAENWINWQGHESEGKSDRVARSYIAASTTHLDHVLCQSGRRATADQGRHGVRVSNASSDTATGLRAGQALIAGS